MTKEVPRTSVLRDEELIARLQNSKGWPTLGNAAADRIEALIAERDALFRRATLAEEWRDHDKTRAEAAEAKLAKAVEAAEKLLDAYSAIVGAGNPWGDELRAALAGIKSHSDEFATQKGESHE